MTRVKVLTQKLQHLKTKRVSLNLGLIGGPGIGKSFTARAATQTAKMAHLTIFANASNSVLAQVWLNLLEERPSKRLPSWVPGLLERLKRNETVPFEGVTQALATILGVSAPFVMVVEDAQAKAEP
jgi:hypothetical protein